MSTKIELEEPFKSKWKYGYLITNKEPRRNVILFNSKTDRTTISYARYLMSVKLGRFLDKTEHVDHINGNQMDDRLENFQLLSILENNRKMMFDLKRKKCYLLLKCGSCGKEFSKPKNNTYLKKPNTKSTYCSRSCAGKALSPSEILKEYTLGFWER